MRDYILKIKYEFPKLVEIMNADPIMNDTPIEVNDLVRYYGALLAVDHISLEIKKGEVLGFLGPNGAGKTTSIRMMCGLFKPTSGSVYIQGKRIEASGSIEVRSRVGICPWSFRRRHMRAH